MYPVDVVFSLPYHEPPIDEVISASYVVVSPPLYIQQAGKYVKNV